MAFFLSEIISCKFFDRSGGSSKGLFSSLNGSKFVGDDSNAVLKNLDKACIRLHSDRLITLKQIHSNKVLKVTPETLPDQECDAMVTSSPGIALGILTADCAPVLLCDEQNGVIGAAHAGWRGAVSGVIENTVKEMKRFGAVEIKASIGPCIHVESYEIDNDFRKNFADSDSDCFFEIDSKMHFDLPKFCQKTLLKSGIKPENITVAGVDTYASHDTYFSYRYARQNSDGICGRNISAICLRK